MLVVCPLTAAAGCCFSYESKICVLGVSPNMSPGWNRYAMGLGCTVCALLSTRAMLLKGVGDFPSLFACCLIRGYLLMAQVSFQLVQCPVMSVPCACLYSAYRRLLGRSILSVLFVLNLPCSCRCVSSVPTWSHRIVGAWPVEYGSCSTVLSAWLFAFGA